MILQGKLSSEKEARAYYEQKPLADKRQKVIDLKKAARTALWSAVFILSLAVPVYLWIKPLEQVMGAGAAIRYAGGIVTLAVLMLPLAWCFWYGSRRMEKQLNSAQSQPEGHDG